MALRPDFILYKNQVIELLDSYNFTEASKPFNHDLLVEITKNQIKEAFLYQESIYRCAVGIMAIVLDASKQLKVIQESLLHSDLLSNLNTKGKVQ